MPSTTIKVSTHTRDRIRSFDGPTHESTIIDALDALESQRFWSQAEAYAQWRASLPDEERRLRKDAEDEIDAAFDGMS